MTATTGDQVGTGASPIDPKLGPLANNGGPSLTHALLAGSPAIDVANPAAPGGAGTACAATDQRWALRPADGDGNGSALCDIGAYEAGATVPGTGVVITYLYDNLYRLKTALYSTGEVFTYTYDAVGNRLNDGAPSGANVYAYDDANRLSTANGTAYTWDNNGNLLADGVLTYTYDSANRLTAINASLYTFGYNGLGDRLLQSASGSAITDTLDLAAGLTQVLSEKKGAAVTTYLYGNGRLAQRANAGMEFFLGDGLGSAILICLVYGYPDYAIELILASVHDHLLPPHEADRLLHGLSQVRHWSRRIPGFWKRDIMASVFRELYDLFRQPKNADVLNYVGNRNLFMLPWTWPRN
jgi:hypothetical protein